MTTRSIDQYVHAATRDNTRRSYRAAVNHFESEWGGFLPATANAVAQYLADHAEKLSINTLRQRLAALGQWHVDQGFPDPTKSPVVRKVFRGIQALHPAQEKRAAPLQLDTLSLVIGWIDQELERSRLSNDVGQQLRLSRDKALVLVGFWRGFRSDELANMEVQQVQASAGEGMTIYLTRSKTDRQFKGHTYKTPALSYLCPVTAYVEWIRISGLKEGPVFRAVNRWGQLQHECLNSASIIPLLRKLLTKANIAGANLYSSHSLRRGFATWASANGWDLKQLMEYVGWKNIQSAMRYIDSQDAYQQQMLERMLPDSKNSKRPIIEAFASGTDLL